MFREADFSFELERSLTAQRNEFFMVLLFEVYRHITASRTVTWV